MTGCGLLLISHKRPPTLTSLFGPQFLKEIFTHSRYFERDTEQTKIERTIVTKYTEVYERLRLF